jgi:hypothetical protein
MIHRDTCKETLVVTRITTEANFIGNPDVILILVKKQPTVWSLRTVRSYWRWCSIMAKNKDKPENTIPRERYGILKKHRRLADIFSEFVMQNYCIDDLAPRETDNPKVLLYTYNDHAALGIVKTKDILC